jgi:hypothetical protein
MATLELIKNEQIALCNIIAGLGGICQNLAYIAVAENHNAVVIVVGDSFYLFLRRNLADRIFNLFPFGTSGE